MRVFVTYQYVYQMIAQMAGYYYGFHEDSEYVISFAVPQTVGQELGESWVRVGREFLSHINMYIK